MLRESLKELVQNDELGIWVQIELDKWTDWLTNERRNWP
jgi:hypothetical protein